MVACFQPNSYTLWSVCSSLMLCNQPIIQPGDDFNRDDFQCSHQSSQVYDGDGNPPKINPALYMIISNFISATASFSAPQIGARCCPGSFDECWRASWVYWFGHLPDVTKSDLSKYHILSLYMLIYGMYQVSIYIIIYGRVICTTVPLLSLLIFNYDHEFTRPRYSLALVYLPTANFENFEQDWLWIDNNGVYFLRRGLLGSLSKFVN